MLPKASVWASVLALTALLAVGCGDDDDAGDRTTGIAALDAVIDAVQAQDVTALHDLLDFQTLACTTEFGAGGPPKCADGEANGTQVTVTAYSSCEPGWLRDDAMLTAALENTVANAPVIYAAFVPPADFTVGQQTPQYVLLFEADDPRVGEAGVKRGVLVGVTDGRVLAIAPACGVGNSTASLIPASVDDFLIEPPR